jgi:hypothetical protein
MTNDTIEQFQKKHAARIVLLLCVFALTIVALGVGIFLLNGKVAEVKAARTERLVLMNNFQAITNLSHDKKMADLVLPSLEDALPLDIDVPTVVIPRFKALAAAHGVTISLMLGQKAPAGDGSFSGVAFSIRADGSQRNLIDFIGAIESGKNTISVKDWNIALPDARGFELVLNGSIYVRTQ